MPLQESCMGCHWANVTMDDRSGDPMVECRRYPPVVFVTGDEPQQVFPTVDAEMWCGEWTRPPA